MAKNYPVGMGKPEVRYLIDSNVWIEAAANVPSAVKALKCAMQGRWVGYSAITRLELFSYPDLNAREERQLKELLGLFVEVDVTAEIIDKAITIRRSKRVRIPDALIAASALQTSSALITRNVDDFKKIVGLNMINPEMM